MINSINNLYSWNNRIHYQLPVEDLVRQCLERKEGSLSDSGALVIHTGLFTGRSPDDKYIVDDEVSRDIIDWNRFNQPIAKHHFLRLLEDMRAHLQEQTEIWIRDAFVCAAPAFRVNLRIVNEHPSSNHFAANMFCRPDEAELEDFEPDWLIIQAPGFRGVPDLHGTRQANFTILSFQHRTILIGGTGYTGEIKKSVFTLLNFLLPFEHGILSMHCSANTGNKGDTALFFGLSGTGKTTLSADPERRLIGDDEHGWNNDGIFNFEGGCYAKVIDLSEAGEPDIYQAIRPGALVENTTFFPGTQKIDFSDRSITENTRVSYPLEFIRNSRLPTLAGPPENIFFLTCDAYGVLPPVCKLTPEQAIYYFLSGYTARVSGTENGIRKPQATFSACFGAPFLPLAPAFYADLFMKRIGQFQANVWMVNTGWTGGPYGTGNRISLKHTRAIIRAVLDGQLDGAPFQPDKFFGLYIPHYCPGVPEELLKPENTWTDESQYRIAAEQLAVKFRENIIRTKGIAVNNQSGGINDSILHS